LSLSLGDGKGKRALLCRHNLGRGGGRHRLARDGGEELVWTARVARASGKNGSTPQEKGVSETGASQEKKRGGQNEERGDGITTCPKQKARRNGRSKAFGEEEKALIRANPVRREHARAK